MFVARSNACYFYAFFAAGQALNSRRLRGSHA
nr:MAG TPA: hypothetical protein [Caudoviricetes sp.]